MATTGRGSLPVATTSEDGVAVTPTELSAGAMPADGGAAPADRGTGTAVGRALLFCAVVVATMLVAHDAERGAVSVRIGNPAVHGAPRPVPALFGWTHWLGLCEWGTVVALTLVVVACAVAWRRHPKHPVLLMVIACTSIVWMDPVMNWAPYAVYNPQLWHWPVTWPLVSVSPTVEPFIVVGYAMFYATPFFPAVWLLRRLQRRRAATSFVWRHPLVSLAGLIYVVGFAFDAILEMTLVRTQLYVYSQVIPFGSVFTGTTHQFPLLWESSLVTTVMIPAGVLVYRDGTGRTVAEKLAQRLGTRWVAARPALATFAVLFVVLNGCYLVLYGGSFAVIRATGAATAVACPYPFPEAKVYDPQGLYEEAGQHGPYMAGIMDGWESGQSGRPVVAPSAGGRCSSGHG